MSHKPLDGSRSIHDNILVSYEVGCQNREIILHTEYPYETREWTDVVFSGVECYEFQNDGVSGTIIFSVDPVEPMEIYVENQEQLVKGVMSGWTNDWAKTREAATHFFREEMIQGYHLSCSLGMHGWILARKMTIEPREGPSSAKSLPPTLEDKVSTLLAPAGGSLQNVQATHQARNVMDRMVSVLTKKHGKDKAEDIAFHVSDWISDAAFLTALHLFPEAFTLNEIEEGIEALLIHAPNHLAAAATLAGHGLMDIWSLGVAVEANEQSGGV